MRRLCRLRGFADAVTAETALPPHETLPRLRRPGFDLGAIPGASVADFVGPRTGHLLVRVELRHLGARVLAELADGGPSGPGPLRSALAAGQDPAAWLAANVSGTPYERFVSDLEAG